MGLAQDRFIAKLQSATELTPDETSAIRGLPLAMRRIESDAEVVHEGDRPSDCCLAVEGFLVRQKITPEGRRQIMSIHTPGDLIDLQSIHLRTMDHSVAAAGPATVALVPHALIQDLLRRHPRLADALWREALIDAAIHREWICNIGARSAYRRTAHLLCEIFVKMQVVGLAAGDRCTFPMSQRDLGDCMGLSAVHVNRTLQQLRVAGLIRLSGKALTIPDFNALSAAGQFDPSYLHLRPQAA